MRILNLLLILFFLISSCTRQRLRGDKDILVGRWHWVKTTSDGSACNPPDFPIISTPQNKGREESVEFIKKGKFYTYINDERQQEFNLKFTSWQENSSDGTFSFIVKLDKNDELLLSGEVDNDTLILNNFSIKFSGSSGDCYRTKAYFVRE